MSFNLKAGVSLGDAVEAVQNVADHTLPSTITPSFSGTAKVFQASLRNLSLLLLVAYGGLHRARILYESFIHPITILSGLPSAGFGALLTLILFKWTSAFTPLSD